MLSSQISLSRRRKMLEKEVESKQRSLECYRKYIDPHYDECISVLEAKKSKKEEDLRNLHWFQYWAKSNISNEILKLRRRIDELKSLEECEKELEELKQNLYDIPGEGWGGYPGILDDKIVEEYRNKFKSLPFPLTQQVPYINIVMIGEAGSGKSSFLRTFTTALANSTYIKDVNRIAPLTSKEEIVTTKMQIQTMYMDNEKQLPCKLYDVPGITWQTKVEDIEEIIDIIMKPDCNVSTESDIGMERHSSPQNDVHCILYFLYTGTSLDDLSPSTKIMTTLQRRKDQEDGVRQFVVVTFIDRLGVPNDNMKNAYQYPTVRRYCETVSAAFGVDLLHIIPVSNYYEEVVPNDAKDAMSLFNMWRVVNSAKEYIERQRKCKETGML